MCACPLIDLPVLGEALCRQICRLAPFVLGCSFAAVSSDTFLDVLGLFMRRGCQNVAAFRLKLSETAQITGVSSAALSIRGKEGIEGQQCSSNNALDGQAPACIV